jgi:hypothetical protein
MRLRWVNRISIFLRSRREASIGLQRLLDRFPDLQLAVKLAEMRWHKRLGIRALARLPVQLAQ